ncbi:hypothetical protein DACRYDRAFT_109162 [Dacryopinax primogenitus]|uniref:Uncharacterized protein n=1 Tax=Dacryopinax primogenitus (strain DJM 731) TaxID=1858805 RepID=M5G3K5_DACPD|nr:uncharacterized protein DACRYDRAFT_109162 [Dacryopinax primogenitus]EJU00442.1 hypothetical protein DACRYDRAFT_109162 [Dacryopinax primogenitus]
MTNSIEHKPITAVLNYCTPSQSFGPSERPLRYAYEPPPAGRPETNEALEAQLMPIHDVRGRKDIGLDMSGFAVLEAIPDHHPSVYEDENWIKTH